MAVKAVFGFGRVNPPTLGHARVVERISELSQSADVPGRFYLSYSNDAERNPISPLEKLALVQRAFPSIAVALARTVFDAALQMSQEGIDEGVLVVGEDRAEEFARRFMPYQGSQALGLNKLTIVPVRRPAGAMSASLARALAKAGDWGAFRKTVPGDEMLAVDLFSAVRNAMGV
jgi:nicotinic acid mononucleotide adenylyltransferase